ncbi:MarR family winged helix-turn-helix transcriptional regulator [Tepidicaulis sp.]|uniref:MarR family winged helix-turn-helix transcriptional regulator n=1 Tax=Tepidicaulis sp. TaxID=1920809 RepID=UPI003B5CAF6A
MEDQIDRRLILAARAVVFLFREFEQLARRHDITVPQYRFLMFLKRGPKRAGELAVEASIRKPTASALIADMERRGLIMREKDADDARSVKLRLTESGLAKHREFELELARFLPTLLYEGDMEKILDALSELAYLLDTRRYEASPHLADEMAAPQDN